MSKDANSPKIKHNLAPEDVAAGIRPDEIGQILNLKKNLDYSDILAKYAGRYLQMGWDLVAVNPKGAMDLDLDFRQPEGIWTKRLTDLGLEGVQVNLGVRTGPASNLLVLEIRPGAGELPFATWDDWRSGCVAQVGGGYEQHYYVLPQGWSAPLSCFIDPHRLMVFGSGGLVLAPPSLEPRVQESLRWLRPPWESPPSRPSPRLWQYLQENVPAASAPEGANDPPLPAWEEIFGIISAFPAVLQVLLAPAANGEEYYPRVLQTAMDAGLTDPQVLLGLLWHAPLGDARSRPHGLRELQNLITVSQREQAQVAMSRVETLIQELQGAFATLSAAGKDPPPVSPSAPSPTGQSPPPAPAASGFNLPTPPREGWPGPGGRLPLPGRSQAAPGAEAFDQAAAKLLWMPRDGIMVERDRYETMLYELGKLGAWHEIQKHYFRENKLLKEKLESQQQKEISRLRKLCSQNQKKDKGWWR